MPRCHHLLPCILAAALLGACSQSSPSPTEQAQAASAPAPAPSRAAPDQEEAAAIQDNHIDVPFPEGSAALGPDAQKQLDLAARLFRDAAPALLFSAGCTDASGDEYANLILSARRAKAVKQALAERGIPADRILLRAYGVSEPVASPASIRNRRVMVTWRMS